MFRFKLITEIHKKKGKTQQNRQLQSNPVMNP